MIDEDRTPGRFILSGSARTAVTADIHAGAGRILPLRLRPMILSERRGQVPAVPLADLPEHGIDAVRRVRSELSPAAQVAPTAESGLPGYLAADPTDHHEALRTYLDLAVARDLAEIAPAARNARKLRRTSWACGTASARCSVPAWWSIPAPWRSVSTTASPPSPSASWCEPHHWRADMVLALERGLCRVDLLEGIRACDGADDLAALGAAGKLECGSD